MNKVPKVDILFLMIFFFFFLLDLLLSTHTNCNTDAYTLWWQAHHLYSSPVIHCQLKLTHHSLNFAIYSLIVWLQHTDMLSIDWIEFRCLCVSLDLFLDPNSHRALAISHTLAMKNQFCLIFSLLVHIFTFLQGMCKIINQGALEPFGIWWNQLKWSSPNKRCMTNVVTHTHTYTHDCLLIKLILIMNKRIYSDRLCRRRIKDRRTDRRARMCCVCVVVVVLLLLLLSDQNWWWRKEYTIDESLNAIHAIYWMEEALAAIRGHRSAHSLATGPVMVDPFISPLLFTITPALSSK